jgi:hypothetical protein
MTPDPTGLQKDMTGIVKPIFDGQVIIGISHPGKDYNDHKDEKRKHTYIKSVE